MTMATTKTDKILRLRTQQGRTMQIVREHYLREDVPCYSSICMADCAAKQDSKLSTLPCDVTHYLVPDCQVARQYLEILEIQELRGIVFFQTVAHSVQHDGSRRHHKRLMKLVSDPTKRSIVFCNEFQKYAYCPRKAGESLIDWHNRSVHSASAWYHDHLAGQKPIIILSQDPQMKTVYGSKQVGVHVYRLEEYLKAFWPDLLSALDLLESLTASIDDAVGKDKEYKGYLPPDILESGLKNGKFIVGCLQVNKHNAQQEAFVRRTSQGSKDTSHAGDILVRGMSARNRAVHGDMVVAQLLPRSQWTSRSGALSENNNTEKLDSAADPEDDSDVMTSGHIVGVLQRNWRDYVCSFAENEDSQKKAGKVLVVPMDWRIPKIRISTRQVDTLRDNRIIARIDHWEVGSQYPNGHFVRSLGAIGDLETEIAATLVEYSISVTPFSEGQMRELPSNSEDNPWTMEREEVERRRDLRTSHLIFSIDPKGCEDVDDTLSVRELPNGHFELGVHIADVTAFVRPNGLTDLEARSRSTTVYLADRRYDMLPAILSADLCSLISGVDRYAMSVIWELDDKYEVVNVWYGRTIITSAYKLFYEIAQEIHDGASDEEIITNVPELQNLSSEEQQNRLPPLRWAVNNLMEIARKLKCHRTREGALELEGSEVTIQMDKSKEEVRDLIPKQSLEIHETIAECMIFANQWVAKKIYESFPSQALLRHHPLPRTEHFGNLINCAGARGFEVRTTSNKALAESLDNCVDPADPTVNKICRSLATQAMSNAAYFSTGSLSQDQYFHYGLALDYYTHFTSPIRRYADVLVHRLLLAAIETTDSTSLLTNKDLDDLCTHINKKHRAAQNAQKESVELFQTLFFKDKPDSDESRVVDAIVFQLRANGVLVFIPRYGIKGAVYLRSKEGLVAHVGVTGVFEWTAGAIDRTDRDITVTSVYGSHSYRLLDHITVKVTVQDSRMHACSLRLELVNNQAHTATFTTDLKGQKAEIIKEVTQTSGDQRATDTTALGPDYQQWKAQYGQTAEKNSLYSLMQSLYEIGLKNL